MPEQATALLSAIAARIGTTLPEGQSVAVHGVTHDSRQVSAGDLFVCIKGFHTDGHIYADQAAQRGAAALVVDHRLPVSLPQLVVSDTRRALALAAAEVYGDPSRRLRVIGVTGTKGKTTTTYLIQHLLRAAGHQTGLIGTIQQVAGDQTKVASRTTPEASDLQRLFYEMVQAGWDSAVMEVSSHAVELQRTVATEFDVAVFTNIARDHMDFHPTFDHYLGAKARFFTQAGQPGSKGRKVAVVNSDDPHWEAFVAATSAPVIRVGMNADADLRATELDVRLDGVDFLVTGSYGTAKVHLRLTGRFNVSNALCALAVAVHESVPLADASLALEQVAVVPGRFERVDAGQDFLVIVDYAHTPESLENVLSTARNLTRGRVIAVAGAGGDRDRGKRPLMGKALALGSDYTIVTSDNPRSEDPAAICQEIVRGIQETGLPHERYEVITDRRQAIAKSIAIAKPGDIVLIAGKGHENYQQFADRTVHFDDREEAMAALRQRV